MPANKEEPDFDPSQGERLAPMTEAELAFDDPGEYRIELDMQGTKCRVCKHDQEEVINKHLVERDLTLEQLAKVYGVSSSSLSRHRQECIAGLIKKGREVLMQQKLGRRLVKTLEKVDDVYEIGMELLKQTAADRQVGDSLALMNKLEDNLRLRGELAGELVGPNGPAPAMAGAIGGQLPAGGRVQLIVLPQVYGKTPEQLAKLVEAKPLEIEGEVIDDDEDGPEEAKRA